MRLFGNYVMATSLVTSQIIPVTHYSKMHTTLHTHPDQLCTLVSDFITTTHRRLTNAHNVNSLMNTAQGGWVGGSEHTHSWSS